MKQYQVWVMLTLLAIIAGVIVYANFKGDKKADEVLSAPATTTEE